MKNLKFPANGKALLELWERSESIPFGVSLFSRVLGWAIPYTSSISPKVLKLERGHATVSLADRRAVRNHLSSIHAIALANIGEFSTGLALMSQMPVGMRAILGSIKVDYIKKARGELRAEARCDAIEEGVKTDRFIVGEILDSEGVCVARVEAKWVVGPEVKRVSP